MKKTTYSKLFFEKFVVFTPFQSTFHCNRDARILDFSFNKFKSSQVFYISLGLKKWLWEVFSVVVESLNSVTILIPASKLASE